MEGLKIWLLCLSSAIRLRHSSRPSHSSSLSGVLLSGSSDDLAVYLSHAACAAMGDRCDLVGWRDARRRPRGRISSWVVPGPDGSRSPSAAGGPAAVHGGIRAGRGFDRILCRQSRRSLPPGMCLASIIPPEKHARFLADLWAHSASYLVGIVGGLRLCAWTLRKRKRLSQSWTS
jgi:hypothetical protein